LYRRWAMGCHAIMGADMVPLAIGRAKGDGILRLNMKGARDRERGR
jgi:hypothetical protein